MGEGRVGGENGCDEGLVLLVQRGFCEDGVLVGEAQVFGKRCVVLLVFVDQDGDLAVFDVLEKVVAHDGHFVDEVV